VSFFIFPPVSQSGCKTKTSFCFPQEKLEKFLKLSYRFSFSAFLPITQGTFRVLRGANVKSFFFSRKLFRSFFFRKSLFQNMMKLPECLRAFFAVAGAKVEPFSASASFFLDFFQSFSDLFPNSLATAYLQIKYFSSPVRFFFLWRVFYYFPHGLDCRFCGFFNL
jgi:hypothetical protein